MAFLHIVNTAVLSLALTVAGGTFAPVPVDHEPTPAELAFADAPQGVDSMVTGPVSAGFRAQQEQSGCAAARWPDVPLECFPK